MAEDYIEQAIKDIEKVFKRIGVAGVKDDPLLDVFIYKKNYDSFLMDCIKSKYHENLNFTVMHGQELPSITTIRIENKD